MQFPSSFHTAIVIDIFFNKNWIRSIADAYQSIFRTIDAYVSIEFENPRDGTIQQRLLILSVEPKRA